MNFNEAFFESYNLSVEAAYDAYFRIAEKDILKGLSGNEEELSRYLENEALKWSATLQSDLGSRVPAEFLNSIDNLDTLVEMFREGAVICDDSLPGIFLDKLQSFGDAAIDALTAFCLDRSLLDESETSFMVPLMAVQVLGEWKVAGAAGILTGMFDYNGEVSDLLYEKAGMALSKIGKPAIDSIIKAIESGEADSPRNEYLLQALADAARGSGSETAYRCLKNAFLGMTNKSIGAYCLGNYGDGRAIPALRGYLVKNRDSVDKDTFYDIVSAIERLGGNTDDLGRWED